MALHGGEAPDFQPRARGSGSSGGGAGRVWGRTHGQLSRRPASTGKASSAASLPQDYEVQDCLKQLMMSLLRLYRFSPIVPDLGLQVGVRAPAPSPLGLSRPL